MDVSFELEERVSWDPGTYGDPDRNRPRRPAYLLCAARARTLSRMFM
ncbi:MAG: hypothetical protein BWX88_04063 [Planctomycetes bacterium ADurb.Bin126]|nr:MAG: hypothetical protein BWX88_04063 [Planctomycetes bacterium ADurb.Bin126]